MHGSPTSATLPPPAPSSRPATTTPTSPDADAATTRPPFIAAFDRPHGHADARTDVHGAGLRAPTVLGAGRPRLDPRRQTRLEQHRPLRYGAVSAATLVRAGRRREVLIWRPAS